jgi:hypothetical protein
MVWRRKFVHQQQRESFPNHERSQVRIKNDMSWGWQAKLFDFVVAARKSSIFPLHDSLVAARKLKALIRFETSKAKQKQKVSIRLRPFPVLIWQ